ncbi:Hypothetical protein D9617_2g056250 [Elsinoe fawcettii]|nr:Hypothetical protein D9617_2g056250 [Elsinoe fawcettii]
MATSTAWSWSDADLLRPSRKSYHSLGQPVTPVVGARKVSGKRKRSTTYAVEDHPLKPSPSPALPAHYRTRIMTPVSIKSSPTPLVNERYQVAAGPDTPDMTATVMTMNIHDTPRLDGFRSTWEASDMTNNSRGTSSLAREGNGRPRVLVEASATPAGWTASAFNMFGGVASKVFGLCYSILPKLGSDRINPEQDFDMWQRAATPLPGMYPEENSGKEVDDTPIRPAKRLHVGSGNDWIMVGKDSADNTARLSPRKLSRNMENASSPQCSASVASSRRSIAPRSRKSISVSHAYTGSPTLGSPSISAGHRRRASVATVRSPARTLRPGSSMQHIVPHRSIQDLRATPERDSLSPEAHVLLQRRDKKERHADKSMRKMSRQVQELIRQGQQALGSDFKLSMDDDFDEGIDLDE